MSDDTPVDSSTYAFMTLLTVVLCQILGVTMEYPCKEDSESGQGIQTEVWSELPFVSLLLKLKTPDNGP